MEARRHLEAVGRPLPALHLHSEPQPEGQFVEVHLVDLLAREGLDALVDEEVVEDGRAVLESFGELYVVELVDTPEAEGASGGDAFPNSIASLPPMVFHTPSTSTM